MSNNILFVFEGEKTEAQIKQNLTKYFLNERSNIHCAYCSDIYQLHAKISKDEDLDTFILLKERAQNTEILASYSRDDFAEIYMFFDYDGHATIAEDAKIKELLNFFDEETETGKLLISYPMVEAIKHISETVNFKELKVKGKENINYKKIVNEESKNSLKNLTTLTYENWIELIQVHLKKMNFIVNDDYTLPKKYISQHKIFENQLNKYLNIDSTVAVLSAFPVFIFDYYGYNKVNELIQEK